MKQDYYQIKHSTGGPFVVEHVTYKNGTGKGVAKEISTHSTRAEAVAAKKVLKDKAPPPRQLEQGPGRGKRPETGSVATMKPSAALPASKRKPGRPRKPKPEAAAKG